LNKHIGDLWRVISLVLDIQLLESLLLGCSILWLLGSLLLGRSELWPRSGHMLLSLIVQSLKKGIMSVLGGRSALQIKTMIKYIKQSSKVIMNEDM
jgi:hypothetical protein